jgi:hypothetical protein
MTVFLNSQEVDGTYYYDQGHEAVRIKGEKL